MHLLFFIHFVFFELLVYLFNRLSHFAKPDDTLRFVLFESSRRFATLFWMLLLKNAICLGSWTIWYLVERFATCYVQIFCALFAKVEVFVILECWNYRDDMAIIKWLQFRRFAWVPWIICRLLSWSIIFAFVLWTLRSYIFSLIQFCHFVHTNQGLLSVRALEQVFVWLFSEAIIRQNELAILFLLSAASFLGL